MTDTNVINAIKRSVGLSLAGPAGDVCMRTQCQDIIPKQLAKACRYAAQTDSSSLLSKSTLGT